MPAQQVLVQKYLDWGRVEKRLEKFHNIQRHFPKAVLEKGINKPPYYCHYMAWRLGAWPDGCEKVFEYFDKLLGMALGLENWGSEFKSLQGSCDFAEFWSLLWQLQVAQFFLQSGDVCWCSGKNKKGPDLTVKTEQGTFYVECYTYRKSFGMENFIDELMQKIDGNICVKHQANLPFKLPVDNERKQFLDELFALCLDPKFLENKRKEARKSWPVYFRIPFNIKNFYVYLEGATDAYAPSSNAGGDSRCFLEDAIKKGVDAKKDSNNLDSHRPNILAINYLLSPDYQMACSALTAMGEKNPGIDFGKSLDAVLLAFCGIDCELSASNSLPMLTRWSKDVAQRKFYIKGL